MKRIIVFLIALSSVQGVKASDLFISDILECSVNSQELAKNISNLEINAKKECSGDSDPELCEVTKYTFIRLSDVISGKHEIDHDQLVFASSKLSELNRNDTAELVRKKKLSSEIEAFVIEDTIEMRNQFLEQFSSSSQMLIYNSNLRLDDSLSKNELKKYRLEASQVSKAFGCFITIEASLKR